MSLEIKNLTKRYKRKTALDAITLTLHPDTIYALLGNNGAGKSTLLNIINNRIFASEGTVTLNGQPLMNNSAALRHLYMMSEDNMFPANMKVKEIFTLSDAVYGDFDWDLANQLIEDFELPVTTSFKKLSTGYRTIAKLVAALCVNVDYIFLDEPVLGLDANHRDMFYQRLMETYTARPRCFVISTHLIEEITSLVEQVILIEKGRILTQTDAETLTHAGHAISGERGTVDAFAASNHLEILGERTLSGHKTLYVSGPLPRTIPESLRVEALGLQDYFIHLTQHHSALGQPLTTSAATATSSTHGKVTR